MDASLPSHILICLRVTQATRTDVNPFHTQQNGKHSCLLSTLHSPGVLSILNTLTSPVAKHRLSSQSTLQEVWSPRESGAALVRVWEGLPGPRANGLHTQAAAHKQLFLHRPAAPQSPPGRPPERTSSTCEPARVGTRFENSQVGRTETGMGFLLPQTGTFFLNSVGFCFFFNSTSVFFILP